jgi:Fe-Mn family superoxide dismutase
LNAKDKENGMSEQHMKAGMDRRKFIATAAGAAGVLAAANMGLAVDARATNVILPRLPWAEDALEPYISARTINYHFGKHHAGYVKKTNAAIKGTELENAPLPKIVITAFGTDTDLYNNAAQVWNHTFYWNCMKPGGGGRPSGKLMKMIETSFGSFENCAAKLKKEAGLFGSGWAWLVNDGGVIRAVSTPDADTPLAHGLDPILTIDCWEHAYYLDYQNRRGAYVDAFLNNLVNWDFAATNV